MLKYKYIFNTDAILSNSSQKLLRFEVTKMPIAVLKNKFVLLIIIFGTLSFCIVRELQLVRCERGFLTSCGANAGCGGRHRACNYACVHADAIDHLQQVRRAPASTVIQFLFPILRMGVKRARGATDCALR